MTTPAGDWRVELFVDGAGACPYLRFTVRLDDATFAALDAAVEHILTRLGPDLCRTEWMKPLGDGLYEFRVRHSADEILRRFGEATGTSSPRKIPVLLRVFCHFHGDKVVLLLSGYDKGDDPSSKWQQKEITQARKHLTAWRSQPRRR